MPIAGLTDVPESYLKLGQIRKGAPKNGNTPGQDLDYFRVTFLKNIRLINGRQINLGEKLQERFKQVYGEKPTALNIQFSNGAQSVWDANYECYKQGGQYAVAGSTKDGLYWIFYRDFDTAEIHISGGRARTNYGDELLRKPIDLRKPLYKNKKGDPFFLEPVGRLQVVIEELSDIAVGYFEFRPESPRDIRQISAELSQFSKVASQFGKGIEGVPFVLLRREEDVPKKIDGKLVASKSWVVHLDVKAEWGARALKLIEQMALPEIVEGEATEEIPQLESGTEPPEQDLSDVNQDTDGAEQPIELLDPHGEFAMKFAMKEWNIGQKEAAKELYRVFPTGTKHMTASEIMDSIRSGGG